MGDLSEFCLNFVFGCLGSDCTVLGILGILRLVGYCADLMLCSGLWLLNCCGGFGCFRFGFWLSGFSVFTGVLIFLRLTWFGLG